MLTRIKSYTVNALSNKKIRQKYLPEKCRICLDDGEIPIFGPNDISEDVTEFGKIKIRKGDNLPQYLCQPCSTLLEAAILFRKTAIQSDEVLKRKDYVDSGTEDSDVKQEDEIYIKKEYLEFDYCSSDSESYVDDFDRLKRNDFSEDDTTNYNPTISEVDTQDSYDNKDFQSDLLQVKQEDGSINGADSEAIMIIVSNKDKIKQEQNEDENSYIDSDNDEETTKPNDQSLTNILPHKRECEVCHTIVPKSEYKVHFKEHRKKYKEKFDKKYCKVECEFCGKQVSKSYLKFHMKMHGTPEEQAERLVKCAICDKTFNMRYYSDHVKRMHPTKHDMKQMNQNVNRTRKYNKCPVCDRNIRASDFKSHLEKHNGPLPRYVCDKCGRVFKHPSAFKTHCLTHGSELKYKCQFCPYRGLHQGLLKIHVRTHTGDYNYKCTECPARFITKSNLTKHLNRHKGLCTFKCEECNKGFYGKRDLEKHIRNVHMFVKQHVCEFCGKAFGHRDNMLSHQLKVHKRDKLCRRGRLPSYLRAELMLD